MMSLHFALVVQVVLVAPAVALGVLLLLDQDDVLQAVLLPSRVRRVGVFSGVKNMRQIRARPHFPRNLSAQRNSPPGHPYISLFFPPYAPRTPLHALYFVVVYFFLSDDLRMSRSSSAVGPSTGGATVLAAGAAAGFGFGAAGGGARAGLGAGLAAGLRAD